MWGLVYVLYLSFFALGTIKWPWMALVALLCMFAVEQWGFLYLPFVQKHTEFTNLLVLSTVALGAILKIGSISLNLRRYKIRLLAATLLGYALLSAFLWAPDVALPIERWKPAWPYLVANLFLATLLINKAAHLQLAHRWLVVFGGILLLLFSIVPEFSNRRILVNGQEDLGLPLALAELSGFVLIAAILYYKKTIFQSVLLGLFVIVAFVIMVKTGSRGQLIFSITSVLIVLPKVLRRDSVRNTASIILGAGALMLALSLVFDQTGLKTDRWAIEDMQDDMAGRFDGSLIVLEAAFKSPATAIFGLGNSASFSPELLGTYPHIVILEVLAEEGAIGLILFVCLVAIITVSGWRLLNNTRLEDSERKALAVNYAFWLFSLMLCFKQGSLITSPYLFLFAALHEKLKFLILVKFAAHRRKLL